MIRDFDCIRNRARLLVSSAVLAVFISALGNDVARAGDDDGVQGYSMKLKTRNFTGDEAGPTGSGLFVNEMPKSNSTEPRLAGHGVLPTERYLLASWGRYWMWFVLQAR
jgi:hypothetical protein